MEAYQQVNASQEEIEEAEGSYGATPKAYSAARGTKMNAKRKPFLKKMLSRTNPANRTSPYDSPRKGLTADDRERARAGSAHGVGTRQDHDYPSQGPGGVTKSAKKLRKQKAMGEFAKEQVDVYDIILSHLLDEGFAATEDAALAIMANMSGEWRDGILEQSAIAARTARVVGDQRQGYHGDADAINKMQDATSKSIGKLKRGQGPVVTPGLPGV